MGMPKIVFRVQMFRGDWDQVWSQMRLVWLMEGLCRVNQTHLRQFDEFKKRGLVERAYPSIYRAGLHYETEKGTEIWPDIPSLLTGVMGKGLYPGPWGDCEDFACARVAEYRELPFHYERKIKRNGKDRTEMADPQYPQDAATLAAHRAGKDWPAPWVKKKGGIPAKPFAKWRRGPGGNYHYHALVLMPDLRLEDPSLVLGMGRERMFHDERMADRMQDPAYPVKLQYATPPKVMVVDPEKPSGYGGGAAGTLDKKISALVKKGMTPEQISGILGDAEVGAYMTNEIPLAEGEFDVDSIIGWNRMEGRFEPKTQGQELRRLSGYAFHE